ncbi:MAG: hypothetical protein KCHDKBKB_02600 [Elusimicrobia bacterium]|nr:hypothetical protein [Elusimicrobiota bacterium]
MLKNIGKGSANVLEILIDQLVPIAKLLNDQNLLAIERALKTAA